MIEVNQKAVGILPRSNFSKSLQFQYKKSYLKINIFFSLSTFNKSGKKGIDYECVLNKYFDGYFNVYINK